MKAKLIAAMACAAMLIFTAGCGEAVSNGLMAGASPETSAMALYSYDGETVTRMHQFDKQQDILDRLDGVKATEAPDWTLADITLPLYGLEMGTTDGWGIWAAWSNGYWITQEGDAYRFDFDFAGLEDDYQWSLYDEFTDFSVFPCARVLSQDEAGWRTALLTPAGEPDPPDGITMTLESWGEDTVTVNITNESGAEWSYGEHYKLQAMLDDVWYAIPQTPGNWGFTDIGLVVQDGETQEKTYHLAMYGDLPPGAYRLVAYGLAVEGILE